MNRKEKDCFAAIDLGATSGRIMLDCGDGCLQEIYRFQTPMLYRDNGIFWDFEKIFQETVTGLQKLEPYSKRLFSVSCDSWAQDFGMLDDAGDLLCPPFSYRDGKCEVSSLARVEYIENNFPEIWKKCRNILHIADLIHFKLTGKMRGNHSLQAISGLPPDFPRFAPQADCEEIGKIACRGLEFLSDVKVISGAGHDTAAAYIGGAPARGEILISLGTWMLTAAETDFPERLSGKHFVLPLPGKRTAYASGGMGLWPFQQCVKLWKARGEFPGYRELDDAAAKITADGAIDPDEKVLFSPENMEEAVFALAGKKLSPAETTALLLRGVARKAAEKISTFGQKFDGAVLAGGAVYSAYLRDLFTRSLPCPLRVSNPEASTAGNIAIQKSLFQKQVAGK